MSDAQLNAPVIQAAGGLVWRDAPGGRQLLVVQRSRYDDWTLPKGKLEPGESWQEAALREVKEETGCTARLQSFAGALGYTVKGVAKVVLFWNMASEGEFELAAQDLTEVDQPLWLPVAAAIEKLDYEAERDLVREQR